MQINLRKENLFSYLSIQYKKPWDKNVKASNFDPLALSKLLAFFTLFLLFHFIPFLEVKVKELKQLNLNKNNNNFEKKELK